MIQAGGRRRRNELRQLNQLRRVPQSRQLFDVVHQAEERPLPLDLRAAAEREAPEPLVVAEIPEHRLHDAEALRVALPMQRLVTSRLHPLAGGRRARGRWLITPAMEERHGTQSRLAPRMCIPRGDSGWTTTFPPTARLEDIRLGEERM